MNRSKHTDWFNPFPRLLTFNNTTYFNDFIIGACNLKEFGNIKEIPHKYRGRHSLYSHYYNSNTISLVNSTYKNILDKYDYSFNNIN